MPTDPAPASAALAALMRNRLAVRGADAGEDIAAALAEAERLAVDVARNRPVLGPGDTPASFAALIARLTRDHDRTGS
ncbi:MAG: hypothetical protein IT557_07460 [Alphaproteobacteria bacterium]|nr:hypothetical protein [Alphaproteobacteria bacterium]